MNMFERVFGQVILGYLGRYFKDIQRHQLKITLWKGEVFLENVELSLEAFDYLQLPFALKQGRVGKLSIKIPWKKLGWDPIEIILENVFLCASQRDDQEWSLEEVERREFAGKKARLAAAELAKLSKRVCENQAGLISYISAKALDSIQVSIRDFHIVYHDKLSDSAYAIFGLKLSSLRTKQTPIGSSGGRGGQVNKIVEITGLEFYCRTFHRVAELVTVNNGGDLWHDTKSDGENYDSILTPCDVLMSLSVNRSGELDNNNPQYSITAEITDLVMSLNEVQLHRILTLWDYLSTCELRNKYGRYRPWCNPLSKKMKGWQILWWHYAQESVLSDVRKRLKKTSWRYFGQRLSSCRKYVNLYKTKLDFLRHDQPVDESTQWELEQLERELDIDDILSYRSTAECELQEFLLDSSTSNTHKDEHSTGKSRGWLNWLSRGMLGAGGTEDSGQFSGVVSDEVIQDIYEATEFNPPILSSGDVLDNDKISICALQFSITRISATLRNMKYGQEIAELILNGVIVECKFWEESATIFVIVNSGHMVYPCSKKAILLMRRPTSEKKILDDEHPSCRLQVDVSPNCEVELSIKGMLQPLDVTIDAEFLLKLMDFFGVLKSVESQHERVLLSLNGIENANGRLLSKAEYILSHLRKVVWDFSIFSIMINVPWRDAISEQNNLAFEAGSLIFKTKCDMGSHPSDDELSYILEKVLSSVSKCNFPLSFQHQDLYDHFEIKLNDFEMKITMPSHSFPICILEKLSASITLSRCLIQDESVLKQLEVYINVSSLNAHFSPSIYAAILGLIVHLGALTSKSESPSLGTIDSLNVASYGSSPPVFGFSTNVKLETVSFQVELENEKENSLSIMLNFQQLDISYALTELEECWILMRALSIITSPLTGEIDSHTLCSSGNQSSTNALHQHDIGFGDIRDDFAKNVVNTEACFILHYESLRKDSVHQKCRICLNDADVHCYPYVIGLLIAFFDKLSSYDASEHGMTSFNSSVDVGNPKRVSDFGFQRFGFSNFLETGSSEHASIPLDRFPFVMLCNSGSLGSLESSLLYDSHEWRKYFSLRDSRIISPQSGTKKVFKSFHPTPLEPASAVEASDLDGSSADTNSLFVIDLDLCGIRVHFHDSSGIIGMISLPTSNSSVLISENYFDILCSTEGLVLTSSWSPQNLCEFLWGPSLPSLSPILNVRVRKEKCGPLSSRIEVCFSIQHVYCILPPEYLAIIIGYFSLSDWSSDANEHPVTVGHEYTETENECSLVYKIEILDSTLILPVQSTEGQFLKIELQQFYCSFIESSRLNNVLKDIPPECWVPAHRLSERNHCLNLFGRDLFLSFLSLKDDGFSSLKFVQDTDCLDIPLIAPLCADVWVTIPCENESSTSPSTTCIMIRIGNCQLIAEDPYFLYGFDGLLDVINQFSQVSDLSKCFKSDVLQFLQLKTCLEQNNAVSPVVSSITFTEVRCYCNSLSMQLNNCRRDLTEPIAKAEMQFMFSASLRNDILLDAALSSSSLALYSLPGSVLLARFKSTGSASSVLDFSLAKANHGGNELLVSLPSVDVWLYLSHWTEALDCLKSFPGQSSVSEPDCVKQEADVLIMKSDNICITFHFPVLISDEGWGGYQVDEGCGDGHPNELSDSVKGKNFKGLAVTLCSKSSEIFVDGKDVKVKSNVEKLNGMVLLSEDESVPSWPLFRIGQAVLAAEINNNRIELVHVEVDVQCDQLDVWISHSILYFCHRVSFNVAEGDTSQFSYGGIDFKVQFRKVSLLLSDGRWSCSGPLFQMLVENIFLHANVTQNSLEGLVNGEVQVNYNNIHKVVWEPFVERWKFDVDVIRKQEMSLNSSFLTDIHLKSTAQLNLNITESLVECIFRTGEMIKDAWVLMGPNDLPESQKLLNSPYAEYTYAGKYAPYVLQNLTSLPLVYNVYRGPVNPDEFDGSEMKNRKLVQPGSSIPIYINDTPEEQLIHVKPAQFSERLFEQKANGVAHQYITIQFDGTSVSSDPISMDLVGLTYFEVDFSMVADDRMENNRKHTIGGFVVPVVFDVSVQRYSKLIRLYSTVVLSNATSMPLELRFDIPFSVSPMILDPICPGQELPLPLHLAEAGRIRWRPVGDSFLWSEVYNLSNLLSQDSKVGFLKSFVCYPAHPNSDPFRCCISVRNMSLPSSVRARKTFSSHLKSTLKQTGVSHGQILQKLDESKKQFVHQVTLSIPLVVNNYLPKEVTLTIESGGITWTAFLSEVETSFHSVEPSHHLKLEIHIQGFKPAVLNFPCTETFCKMAKFGGAKFSLSEIVTFYGDSLNGPIYVTVEKVMDAFSGARELFIFVPFLLYNCTGFPLVVSEASSEMKGVSCIVPSCYDMVEQELVQDQKDGLSLVTSSHHPHAANSHSLGSSSSLSHVVSLRENANPHKKIFLSKPLNPSNSEENFHELLGRSDLDPQSSLSKSSQNRSSSGSQLTLKDSNFNGYERGRARACMFSPNPNSSAGEVMVRASRCLPDYSTEKMPNSLWSSPFSLVPPSDSTTVLVPQPSSNAAFMLSVTSSAVAAPFTGRISAITFQPRYIISNACSKDLCYKQKGTDYVFHLGIGEHSHLHWMDTARELLVSIRYDEPGWQWSGGFLLDHLGDTQVKMRNYLSGLLNMIRVEVQNADVSMGDEKIVGNFHGNSGTNLILISDDETGYMPYRIDNFSNERLRIYQQRCETFETIVHSYTSCPYAWDEPCYPHRLTVEVPGKRVLGSYALDDEKEYNPVKLPSSSQKPERTLHLSIHVEGATKVLHVIDSSYHILNDMKNSSVTHLGVKKKHEQKHDKFIGFMERISVVIPHIGISMINIHPQELLFACAKNITIDLVQSLDQQKLSFQITSLQIDNQLRSSPYPVILSFDRDYRSNPIGHVIKDDVTKPRSDRILQRPSHSSFEPVFSLAVSKWRRKDVSLVSFEYISLRVADFCLELEQELILSLFGFIKNVSSSFQSRVLPLSDPFLLSHINGAGLMDSYATENQLHLMSVPIFSENHKPRLSLPSIVPIGAPWQQIYLLARRQKKIYVEVFDLYPIKLTLSFSSAPWMLRNGILTAGESVIHRGLMALADVEGARIHLKQLTIAHKIASLESLQEILVRHYTRQLLHEMYKVFGSAGVIGNPMGFARSMGLGIRDFLSVPARSIFLSPTGLITGMAQGTTSLLSNTVYAISDAATQFSKAAHKGIVALTFDDQAVSGVEQQQIGIATHSKGVINGVFEGLTGLLQSPIKGAERHGLPGVLSGIALGIAGLVAKPAASILEVTGKTAQSIRNRSRLYQMGQQRFRVRLPRPLSRELPLRPYNWEEAVGTSVLVEADDSLRLKDEILVTCKELKQAGKFVVITQRLVLIVSCSSLVDLGKPEFRGVPADLEWVIESEICLESIMHADCDQGVVHTVGSSSAAPLRQNQQAKRSSGTGAVRWNNPTVPLIQTNLELAHKEDAGNLLQSLLSAIELGKEQGWGCRYLLHRSSIK